MVTKFPLVPIGPGSAIEFYIGIDGLNIWLIVLTALLMVSAVLVSWKAVQERVHEFYAWMLLLQAAMVGVFLSFDIVLFYVFFELTLVPLFFLIGIWGGPQRQYAARKFFVYTLAGSLITLLGVLGLVFTLPQAMTEREYTRPDRDPSVEVTRPVSFAIPQLVKSVSQFGHDLDSDVQKARKEHQVNLADADANKRLSDAEGRVSYWYKVQLWVFAAMMVGFAIKVPLFPVHTWLPLAHVEAPTAGSVLLAGVLLKIGAYGFLRLCIPLVPDASLSFGAPLIGTLAVIGILYGAWCAYAQDDIKKLVAYSSVSHLGYCMLGLFALNEIGLTGGLLEMINHGLSTGGTVPSGRHALRTLSHPQDGRLRRHGRQAETAVGVHGVYLHVERRPAGVEWLLGRTDRVDGHVRRRSVKGPAADSRHPRRLRHGVQRPVLADVVAACLLWRSEGTAPRRPWSGCRSQWPRTGGADTDRGGVCGAGAVSETVPRLGAQGCPRRGGGSGRSAAARAKREQMPAPTRTAAIP